MHLVMSVTVALIRVALAAVVIFYPSEHIREFADVREFQILIAARAAGKWGNDESLRGRLRVATVISDSLQPKQLQLGGRDCWICYSKINVRLKFGEFREHLRKLDPTIVGGLSFLPSNGTPNLRHGRNCDHGPAFVRLREHLLSIPVCFG